MKRTVKTVVIVFIVWVSLGQLLRFAWPEAHHSYSIGIGIAEDRTKVAERYENIIAELTALGLRPEAEIDVPEKREMRFSGNYGNVYDIQIDVSLAHRNASDLTWLRIRAKYCNPRWKEGGSKDHKRMRKILTSLLEDKTPNKTNGE